MAELTLDQLLGSGGLGEAAGMLQEAEPRQRRAVLGEAFEQIMPFISPPGVFEAMSGQNMSFRDIMMGGILGALGGRRGFGSKQRLVHRGAFPGDLPSTSGGNYFGSVAFAKRNPGLGSQQATVAIPKGLQARVPNLANPNNPKSVDIAVKLSRALGDNELALMIKSASPKDRGVILNDLFFENVFSTNLRAPAAQKVLRDNKLLGVSWQGDEFFLTEAGIKRFGGK
jgi:hypothetical protein